MDRVWVGRRSGWTLFSLTIFVLVLSSYLAAGSRDFYYHTITDPSDTAHLSLWRAGELKLVEGSPDFIFAPRILSWVPQVQVAVSRLLGIDIMLIEKIRALSGVVMGMVGMYLIGLSITDSVLGGFLCTVALPVSWLSTLTLGYTLDVWHGYAPMGFWGMAAMLLIWGLWIHPVSSRKPWLPYLLNGLLSNLHLTYSLILLAIFTSEEILGIIAYRGERKRRFFSLLAHGILFTVFCGPQIWMILSHLGEARPEFALTDWWKIMLARKQHHALAWRAPRQLLGAVVGLSLAGALLYITRPLVLRAVWNKLVVSLSLIVCMIFFMVIGTEVLRSPFIVSLTLYRSSVLIPLMIFSLALALSFHLLEHFEASSLWNSRLALGALAGLPVLFSDSWLWDMAIRAARSLRGHLFGLSQAYQATSAMGGPETVEISWWFAGQFLGLAVIIGTFALASSYTPLSSRSGRRIPNRFIQHLFKPSVAVVCLVAGCSVKGIYEPLQNVVLAKEEPRRLSAWEDLTKWIRTSTGQDALLLTPPNPGYISVHARRSSIIDSGSLGYSIYLNSMVGFELDTLYTVYGVDLRHMSEEEVDAFYRTPYTLAMERRYDELDEARILRIKQAFPALSYVITFQGGKESIFHWNEGPSKAKRLQLPVVHENQEYVVYDVRQTRK